MLVICKLFEYDFSWDCLEFSDKMDLTIQMKMFKNVKCRHTICLKFGNRYFTSINMLECEAKASICYAIKENLILYCRKLSAFAVVTN